MFVVVVAVVVVAVLVVVVVVIVVVVVAVVVVAVVVVVGHRSLPGWQSGTSDCAGHGLPPKDFCRVTVRDLSAPCSHTCVHALNT